MGKLMSQREAADWAGVCDKTLRQRRVEIEKAGGDTSPGQWRVTAEQLEAVGFEKAADYAGPRMIKRETVELLEENARLTTQVAQLRERLAEAQKELAEWRKNAMNP